MKLRLLSSLVILFMCFSTMAQDSTINLAKNAVIDGGVGNVNYDFSLERIKTLNLNANNILVWDANRRVRIYGTDSVDIVSMAKMKLKADSLKLDAKIKLPHYKNSTSLNYLLSTDAEGNLTMVDQSSILAQSANAFTKNGNAFGQYSKLGITDSFNLDMIVNNQTWLTVSPTRNLNLFTKAFASEATLGFTWNGSHTFYGNNPGGSIITVAPGMGGNTTIFSIHDNGNIYFNRLNRTDVLDTVGTKLLGLGGNGQAVKFSIDDALAGTGVIKNYGNSGYVSIGSTNNSIELKANNQVFLWGHHQGMAGLSPAGNLYVQPQGTTIIDSYVTTNNTVTMYGTGTNGILNINGSYGGGTGIASVHSDGTIKLNTRRGSTLFGSDGSMEGCAAVEIRSTEKGFLLPRLSNTQRNSITSPVAGLLLYNSTSGDLEIYHNNRWYKLLKDTSSYARMANPGVNTQPTKSANSFIATIGDGATKTFSIEHNLNSSYVMVQFIDCGPEANCNTILPYIQGAKIEMDGKNKCIITLPSAPAHSQYKVMVLRVG